MSDLRTDMFRTGFKNYGNDRLVSKVDIECKNFDTFKKLVETITEILSDELEKNEVKPKYEFKKIELSDDILDMVRDIPYPLYSPSSVSPFDFWDNPYHRHCRQLEEKLKKDGVNCSVTRSGVGEYSFYNLSFRLDKADENCSDWRIKKIFGIRNVGLVKFDKIDDIIYEVILVDENELNDKYLVDGDLVF